MTDAGGNRISRKFPLTRFFLDLDWTLALARLHVCFHQIHYIRYIKNR